MHLGVPASVFVEVYADFLCSSHLAVSVLALINACDLCSNYSVKTIYFIH